MKRTKDDASAEPVVAQTSSIFSAGKDPQNFDMLLERIDEIRLILKRRERRERLHIVGSFLKSVISIGFVVFSGWYFYEYGDDIMKQVADQAAKSAAAYAGQQSEGVMQQLRETLKLN